MLSFFKWKIRSWQDVNHRLATTFRWLQLQANGVGICICFFYFVFFDKTSSPPANWSDDLILSVIMTVLLLALGSLISHLWMADIRRYVVKKIKHRAISPELEQKAWHKIVNLPFASAAISLLNWSLAAVVMPFFITVGPGRSILSIKVGSFLWVAMGIMLAGFVTCFMVFFATELVCRPIWEHFFPRGELIRIKGGFRLNLWHRILIIFLMASLFPLTDMAVVSYQKAQLMITRDPVETLQSLMFLIFFLLAVECSLVLALSMFMSRSIVGPVLDLKSAMSKVAKGDFTARAKVIDNNELGELSLHFNLMTHDLKERDMLLQTLAIAKEVQQNLLPNHPPDIQGLDVAGKSLYCDQTGGDYYDFIEAESDGGKIFVFAVGDVSGHGIPSALLMASARAFLRQRLALPGSLADIINDVNTQFCTDVGYSGRFMTLFLSAFNPGGKTFGWVRAGHDPALVYDPETDNFIELGQKGGIPLGVEASFAYNDCVTADQDFRRGQILFIGTDGIWESTNQAGEMFGKERLKQELRKCRLLSAGQILESLLERLKAFRGDSKFADDVTILIVKKE